jgi:hypothetical protein
VTTAKELFGDSDRPIVLNWGKESDSLDLYDGEQAKGWTAGEIGTVTLPNWPSEYMRRQVNERIRDVLRGRSRLAALIDKKALEIAEERGDEDLARVLEKRLVNKAG